jgi:hypothetical protein
MLISVGENDRITLRLNPEHVKALETIAGRPVTRVKASLEMGGKAIVLRPAAEGSALQQAAGSGGRFVSFGASKVGFDESVDLSHAEIDKVHMPTIIADGGLVSTLPAELQKGGGRPGLSYGSGTIASVIQKVSAKGSKYVKFELVEGRNAERRNCVAFGKTAALVAELGNGARIRVGIEKNAADDGKANSEDLVVAWAGRPRIVETEAANEAAPEKRQTENEEKGIRVVASCEAVVEMDDDYGQPKLGRRVFQIENDGDGYRSVVIDRFDGVDPFQGDSYSRSTVRTVGADRLQLAEALRELAGYVRHEAREEGAYGIWQPGQLAVGADANATERSVISLPAIKAAFAEAAGVDGRKDGERNDAEKIGQER